MLNRTVALLFAAAPLAIGCGGHKDEAPAANAAASAPAPAAPAPTATAVAPADTEHHSKIKGALVGAAAGHVLGGHAVAGAAVGALVQHEKNKKP